MKAGTHKNVKIVGCFVGESKEKNTPYYGIEFENQDGEFIEHAFYLTEKTKEKQTDLLLDMGFKGKQFTDMSDPKFKISDLFGQPVTPIELVIKDEEYTNKEGEIKTKQVVEWVNVGNKVGLSKVDKATAVKIFSNSSLQGLLSQKRQGRPQPEPLEQEDAAGDDTPF